MKRTVLFIIILAILFIYSCNSGSAYEKKWKGMYESGNYKQLISEASIYRDDISATAFVILSKIKLKEFSDIELPDSGDSFFVNVRNFLEWRECIYKEDASNSCDLKYIEGSSLKLPSKYLKDIFNTYQGLPVENARVSLSKAYSEMKKISVEIESDLSQSELIKLKGILNGLYDSEIYRLSDDDIRKKMYMDLINKVDQKLKVISVGIDRPQN